MSLPKRPRTAKAFRDRITRVTRALADHRMKSGMRYHAIRLDIHYLLECAFDEFSGVAVEFREKLSDREMYLPIAFTMCFGKIDTRFAYVQNQISQIVDEALTKI